MALWLLKNVTPVRNCLPVGNPHTEQVALGPLINERQLANVDRIVTETVAAGASVRAGGTHEQLYYRPTVLADVTPAMPARRSAAPAHPATAAGSARRAAGMSSPSGSGSPRGRRPTASRSDPPSPVYPGPVKTQ